MFNQNKKLVDWDYEFEVINPSDYAMQFSINTNHSAIKGNAILKKAFNMTRRILARTKGISVKGDLDIITEFDVPPKYLNYISVTIKSSVKDAEGQIRGDGIHILTSRIDKAKFIRNDAGDWLIRVFIKGEYLDKREVE